ncbi:MAG: Rne/Rng family ribonuclease [Burkholderiaceae bacterium]|nr:Rne/Rng family ribonuclease [Burkholderiaceae bacterium]
MKRMLFNATHAEELRVAIVDGQRLIDLDIETAGREQRKSNIYKGVVTRIEPSLEACFVNYGEERHGFLPFKEIAREYFKPGVDVGRATIKEAIAEGTEMLVQVEKEERGNKGAALTTFISLAGRYLVLMPNNPRGGGVSRRIEGEERQELRETMDQLDVPTGMSLIARTAGIGRSANELQWDLNYLLQLWRAVDDARKLQPGAYLIYQESSLVIRAIRDYFHPDIGEILIDTDDIYEQARQFMLHVMPDMGARVKRYSDDVPLFSRFQIEHQIETAYSRVVPLPSGGAIVIDHTEALVAVDVNSARATRGSDIEETAFRTNLEAAEEVGRQLRLRDLGGLIVIDFIDMESAKNQREVEQRLRDALHFDRARVQMGKISRFGLMELSRQRLRPALNEGSHITCPRCNGTGVIRDVDSSALHILRILQEEAMKEGTAALHVQVPVEVATFLLNEKRTDIAKLEFRLKVTVVLIPNKFIETPNYKIERLKHDDPRLEDARASYAMADEPATETPYQQQKTEQAAAKPRQEAVVKGITPAQPAPLPAAKPVESTPAEKGLFARIMGWFSSGEKAETTERKPEASSERGDRGGRGRGRNERGGRSDQRDRRGGEREGRDQRGEQRGESREGREPRDGRQRQDANRQRDQRREDREPREPRAEQAAEQKQEGRKDRGDRRGRQERGDRSAEQAPEASREVALTSGSDATASAAESLDQERSGRRRRRRGRGGRRDEEGTNIEAATQPAADTALVSGTVSDTSPVSDIAVPTVAPTIVAQAPASEAITPLAATPVTESFAQTPAAVEPQSIAPEVQSTSLPPVSEPIVTAAPVAAAPIQVSEEALKKNLDEAGLQWVQTDPSKAVEEASAEPPPKLGRTPRRNTETAPQEPLVMVETRQNNP